MDSFNQIPPLFADTGKFMSDQMPCFVVAISRLRGGVCFRIDAKPYQSDYPFLLAGFVLRQKDQEKVAYHASRACDGASEYESESIHKAAQFLANEYVVNFHHSAAKCDFCGHSKMFWNLDSRHYRCGRCLRDDLPIRERS